MLPAAARPTPAAARDAPGLRIAVDGDVPPVQPPGGGLGPEPGAQLPVGGGYGGFTVGGAPVT